MNSRRKNALSCNLFLCLDDYPDRRFHKGVVLHEDVLFPTRPGLTGELRTPDQGASQAYQSAGKVSAPNGMKS